MKKSKQLKALLVENPLLQDVVSSLEAQISELANQKIAIEQDFEDLIEENDELESEMASRLQELHVMNSNFASLDSRYQQLIKGCKELIRENEELKYEKETADLASEAEELQEQDQGDQ